MVVPRGVVLLALGLGGTAGIISALNEGVAAGFVIATLIGCGVLAISMGGRSKVGLFLILTGVAWFAGGLFPRLVLVHRVPLAYLLLSYPTGRIGTWPGRLAFGVTILTALAPDLARDEWATFATAVVLAAAALDRFARSAGPARKAAQLALFATLAYSLVLATAAIERLVAWNAGAGLLLTYEVVVSAIAVCLVVGLAAGRWSETTVADLIVDLGDTSTGGAMRDRLAAALGDPTLVIGYWIGDQGRYVDDSGRTVVRLEPGPARIATEIADEGGPVAILIHDRAVTDDPQLVASVGSAVRIAVTNARLQAQINQRVTQLEDSRRRIVRAADAERMRVAGELEVGTQRRLADVATLLTSGAAKDASIREEFELVEETVQQASNELKDLARGVRPVALTRGGLADAVPALAERSTVPVEVTVTVGRLDPAVEGALYFACSEVLTNIAKHASATEASISVAVENEEVVVVIADDGVGGANSTKGTGLRGLKDRIEALGGIVVVESRAGAGTTVVMRLPVHSTHPERLVHADRQVAPARLATVVSGGESGLHP